MTENEEPEGLSPKVPEHLRAAVVKLVNMLHQEMLLGGSEGAWAKALIKAGMATPEQMDLARKTLRKDLKKKASVDRDLEVGTTLQRLEMLYVLLMEKGEYLGALAVVRERARFTGAEQFIKYPSPDETTSIVNEPSPGYFAALDAMGPADREELVQDFEARVFARAEELHREEAASAERLAARRKRED